MDDMDWLEWSDIDRKRERETIIVVDDNDYRTVEANGTTHVLNEDMAMNLYFAIASTFGWQGAFFTHEDVRTQINHRRLCDDLEALEGDELEKAVEKVTTSSDWRKWLTDHLIEQGWEVIDRVIWEQLEWEDN
jgi:hypothetical protein